MVHACKRSGNATRRLSVRAVLIVRLHCLLCAAEQVSLKEEEIHMLVNKAREIFMAQVLLH